jgi:pimeloyl-ACP methyl ester carboxylesterase
LCFGRHDVRNKLKDVRCPVLVFKGEADYFIPDEMLDEVVEGVPDGLAEKCIERLVNFQRLLTGWPDFCYMEMRCPWA